jgi:5'-deoxynucleotidase YfbR-like HD superfamily hydrolase
MLSGRRLNLLDPSPLDIEIEDIAHGLARVARWNGQTTGPHIFSVAQHSLLVDHLAGSLQPEATTRTRLQVLLHDAAEYVIGDMISPFKAVIGDAYRETEARILEAVMRRFDLPAPMTSIAATLAKKADKMAAHLEATGLAGFSAAEARQFFGDKPPASAETLRFLAPWNADDAYSRFIERFHVLDKARLDRKE